MSSTASIRQLQSLSVVVMALELKLIMETNPIKVSQCCISRQFPVAVIKSNCTLVTRRSASVVKVDVAYMNAHVSRHLKEELAWAIDTWLQVISNKKQLYHKETKE